MQLPLGTDAHVDATATAHEMLHPECIQRHLVALDLKLDFSAQNPTPKS